MLRFVSIRTSLCIIPQNAFKEMVLFFLLVSCYSLSILPTKRIPPTHSSALGIDTNQLSLETRKYAAVRGVGRSGTEQRYEQMDPMH